MKLRTSIATTVLVCSLGVAPAFAQTAAQDIQQYMSTHPELQQNPSLMNNPTYLARHPDLTRWLERHPQFDRGRYGHMGAYDRHHEWREADWWHQNDPDWVYHNHPDWIRDHPAWMKRGDYDNEHHWRDREWWEHNHPNWVREHHPHWTEEYNEHHNHKHYD
jgi:hypothetical protein